MPPYGMCIGRLEELISLFIGLCAAPPHPEDISTKRKAWDQVEKIYRAHCDDSYTPMTQSQHQQTAIRHPPSSTFYFGSFNQFVSSALTSSSTRSKVITLHYPSSCSLHTTHTLTFTELRICHTDLMSDHIGEFITVFGWVICLQVMEIIVKEAGLNYLLAGLAAFLSG